MTDMPSELKPCPICQGSISIEKRANCHIFSCCIGYILVVYDATFKQACASWNRHAAACIRRSAPALRGVAPVAWMYRDILGETVSARRFAPDYIQARGYIETPLYAAPQPAPDHDATLQKLAEVEAAFKATAEAAAHHCKAAMDAKAKLANAREGAMQEAAMLREIIAMPWTSVADWGANLTATADFLTQIGDAG